jgi:hypothetical protein
MLKSDTRHGSRTTRCDQTVELCPIEREIGHDDGAVCGRGDDGSEVQPFARKVEG